MFTFICKFHGNSDVPAETRVFATELGLVQHLRDQHELHVNYTDGFGSAHMCAFYCNNCFTKKKWRRRFPDFYSFATHLRHVHGVYLIRHGR